MFRDPGMWGCLQETCCCYCCYEKIIRYLAYEFLPSLMEAVFRENSWEACVINLSSCTTIVKLLPICSLRFVTKLKEMDQGPHTQ